MDDTRNRGFLDLIFRRDPVRLIRAGVAAAGFATVLMAGGAAEAQDAQPFGEAGAFIGYTWGAGGGFTWGIEGRVGADFRETSWCNDEVAFSAAGVARFSFVELRPQVHLGGQGGINSGLALAMSDFGFGYRWGEDGGFSIPMGFELQLHAATTFLRADPLLREVAAGGGFMLPPRVDVGCAVAGRALHDEEGHAPMPTLGVRGEERPPHDLSRELSDVLAAEWGARAKAEWASVPAFLQLAEQLRIAGAPKVLVSRALLAAEDELRHAIGTGRAAMCYRGAPLALGQVTPATRAPATGKDALRRIAVESWVDGCLGEGKAAAAAAREATLAEEPAIAALQQQVAIDEAKHAALAWDVLAWTIEAGGDDTRHALATSRDAAPSESSGSRDDVDLGRHGLLSETEHRSIGLALRERAHLRLDAMLG